MDYVDAKAYFADKLRVDCPVCPALVGELCNTKGVWIHYERFIEADVRVSAKPIFEIGTAIMALLDAVANFEDVFIRHGSHVPPELRTAFIRLSLAKAELTQKSGQFTEDHPTLFDDKEPT